MNPPFGTRNKGVDVLFLEKALELRPKAIYSLHKTSTRKFLIKKAEQEWGLEAKVLAELKFEIPQIHKFHKKKSVDVEVDFIRFEVPDHIREQASSLPPPPPSSREEGEGAAAEVEGVGVVVEEVEEREKVEEE
jgi:hypothetical protein